MKNRYHNLMKWYLIGALIVCLLLIPELLIAKKITPNDTDFVNTFAIMSISTIGIYGVIAFTKFIKFEKYRKLYNFNEEAKAVHELTSEFKPVILKYSADIPKEKFKCQAKVDEDGKIICKIYVDYQTKLDNYEEFLKYFHLNEE